MPEPKTRCTKCGAEILQATATRTGGLCMPCKTGPKPDPFPWLSADPAKLDLTRPLEVACPVESDTGSPVTFHASAQDLLEALDKIGHVGDSTHPNKLEVEAQKGLLHHVIRYRNRDFQLHDDHWGRTGYALINLFESHKATIEVEGKRHTFADLTKEEWKEGTDSLAMHGGFLYRDASGTVIYKRGTWRS
ncbi:MAG TPA: hypothetical protein VGE67_16250 [Haloferula sp.]